MIATSGASAKGAIAVAAAAAALASVLWSRLPVVRYLIGAMFLTAPFDVSKAVVPPLDRFYSPGLYVTVSQALMVLVAVCWGFDRVFVKRLPLPFTPLDRLALVFLALVWIGALHSPGGGLVYASAVSYSLCVLGFYVASHAVESHKDLRLVLLMVIAGFGLQALYVGAQLATQSLLPLPGAKVFDSGIAGAFQEDPGAFRPPGGFDHPNALANYLTLLIPPALTLLFMGRRLPAKVRGLAAAVVVVGGLMLLVTLSRGGWAACLVGVLFVGGVLWRRRIVGSGSVLAAAGIGLAAVFAALLVFPQIIERLTGPDSRSTESRIILSEQALTIIEAHPLIGVGFGNYNRAAFEYIPAAFANIAEDYRKELLMLVVHDHYLLLAAEMGIPTMLFWLFLMVRFVRQAWPLSRWHDPGMFALGVGLAGSLAGQILYLSADNYYADIRIYLLWVCAGLLQSLTLRSAARGTSLAVVRS